MRPKKMEKSGSGDLFRARLDRSPISTGIITICYQEPGVPGLARL